MKIEKVWAWITVDENGDEGIIAVRCDDNLMPLVTGSLKNIAEMQELADLAGKEIGKKSTRVEFVRVDTLH